MHFKRIDQLRGVAALAVVLCHAAVSAETVVVAPAQQSWHWAAWILGWGYLGVPLFFVISGLCIHLPTARARAAGHLAPPDWRRFFQRHFWRLYPPTSQRSWLLAVSCWGSGGRYRSFKGRDFEGSGWIRSRRTWQDEAVTAYWDIATHSRTSEGAHGLPAGSVSMDRGDH
jgi:peptidoglycan/LPS O-acetylase OafA/YrhL